MQNSSLKNKIIISTHSLSQNDNLTDMLIKSGVKYIHMPLINISANKLNQHENNFIFDINLFNNIIFTSKNGVKFFFAKINKLQIKISDKINFFVIGKSTEKYLSKNGFSAKYVNEGNTSEEFTENLTKYINPNDNNLLVLGNLAPNTLQNSINKYSTAQRINIYKTEYTKNIPEEIKNIISENMYDIILFSSPSAVKCFKNFFPNHEPKAACIGKITEKELLRQNIKPLFVSQKSDYENFVSAARQFFNKNINY